MLRPASRGRSTQWPLASRFVELEVAHRDSKPIRHGDDGEKGTERNSAHETECDGERAINEPSGA